MPKDSHPTGPETVSAQPGHSRRAPRQAPASGRDKRPRLTFVEEISALDNELIRLLARRAKLLARLRGGKAHASTPVAIRDEKRLRANWEAAAGKLSRDSLFIRQLFNLLQDLAIPREEAGEKPLSLFNLAPLRSPVRLDLPGPGQPEQAMLWLALAAGLGWSLQVEGVQRARGLMDFVKILNQAGADLRWGGQDDAPEAAGQAGVWVESLCLKSGRPLEFSGKSLFAGEEELAFYLPLFLGLDRPGKTRFTAGRALKSADFTPLFKMLPDLGARLAFALPGSRGLPASLESSGNLPALYVIPADLPLPGVLALLLAAFAWRRPLALSLDRLPGRLAHKALSLLEPFFAAFPQAAAVNGAEVHYETWEADAPAGQVRVALDPVLSAYVLALPFFSEGEAALSGHWAELPESAASLGLLRLAGLKAEITETGPRAQRAGAPSPSLLAGGLLCQDLPENLLPLFWVMNAALAAQKRAGLLLAHAPEGADLALAGDFLAQLGFGLREEEHGLHIFQLDQGDFRESATKNHGWSSPGPYWTLALSLGAFFRSKLKLVNPDSATDIFPDYWALYNALPEPGKKRAREEAAPPRRRIITQSVIELPEVDD